jgi:ATP-dependent DNA ligase
LWTPPVNAKEAVFDGEITVLANGKPDFEDTMERYLAGAKKVALLMETKPAVYVVWDILWLDGKQLTNRPLMERKEFLAQVLADNYVIQKIDWVDGDGLALWEAIRAQGLEGMVAKKKDSRYVMGQRSPAWVKIKNYQEAEVNVFGYSKKDGAVLVGTRDRIQGYNEKLL